MKQIIKQSIFVILLFGITCVLVDGRGVSAQTTVKIGTHPVGSSFNVIGSAVGKMIQKHTPLDAKVIPLSGLTSWLPMMPTGEIDLGIATSADSYYAYFGDEDFKDISKGKGFPLRLVLTGLYYNFGQVTKKTSGIKTHKDIRGKKMAIPMQVMAARKIGEAALANAGLTLDDVKVVPVAGIGAMVKAVMSGKADVTATGSVGMPLVAEMAASPHGALYLSLDTSPEAKARALKVLPFMTFDLIKGGKFPGIAVDTWTQRIEVYVVARPDLPDDVVYTIIKGMWNNHSDIVPIHPRFKGWRRENYASSSLAIPYHPSSIRFLKEKGLWTPELQKRQEELLAKQR